jgi:hypothetical protein
MTQCQLLGPGRSRSGGRGLSRRPCSLSDHLEARVSLPVSGLTVPGPAMIGILTALNRQIESDSESDQKLCRRRLVAARAPGARTRMSAGSSHRFKWPALPGRRARRHGSWRPATVTVTRHHERRRAMPVTPAASLSRAGRRLSVNEPEPRFNSVVAATGLL